MATTGNTRNKESKQTRAGMQPYSNHSLNKHICVCVLWGKKMVEKTLEQTNQNGANGYCIAFWKNKGSCMIRNGPRVCPSKGNANTCVLKHPEIYKEYYRKKIKRGLMRIIRKNLKKPCLLDVNKISIEIMEKFSIRIKNNNEE